MTATLTAVDNVGRVPPPSPLTGGGPAFTTEIVSDYSAFLSLEAEERGIVGHDFHGRLA